MVVQVEGFVALDISAGRVWRRPHSLPYGDGPGLGVWQWLGGPGVCLHLQGLCHSVYSIDS